MKLFESYHKDTIELKLEKKVRMYTCGPTVYDHAHIGNFRSFLTADVIRRTLVLLGHEVDHIINITDVGHMVQDDNPSGAGEDKIVVAMKRKPSKHEGEKALEFNSPFEVAEYYTQSFKEDFKALNLLEPRIFPKASDHIPEMVEIIKTLLAKDLCYKAEDGSYYFSIQDFEKYGDLSKNNLDQLIEGGGQRVNETHTMQKRHPLDFAVWKTDPNHLMTWNTELGIGFPGWHIECSAMAMRYLGETLDIHTGGEDNKFPHHECEIAQSEGATDKTFVRYWVHTKFLMVEGQKMSKSKGNFYTLKDLLEKGYHPLAIRLTLLAAHYTQALNFSLSKIEENEAFLVKWAELRDEILAISKTGENQSEVSDLCVGFERAFKEALSDNINISVALAAWHRFISDIQKLKPSIKNPEPLIAAMTYADQVLGCVMNFVPKKLGADEATHIEALLERRKIARQSKNFVEADLIRKELDEMKVVIKDTPDGKTVWTKQP